MRYNALVTEPALQDIASICEYLDERSDQAADMWIDSLIAAIETLERSPGRCPLIREQDRSFPEPVRQLLVGSYRILFAIRSDVVAILHVRHTARDDLKASDL